MPDMTVYRSRDPRVLHIIELFETEQKTWNDQAKTLLAEFGFADRHWMIRRRSDGIHITGVEARDSDRQDPPAGWRVTDQGGPVLVPDKRRKAGKEAQARIDACRPPRHPRVRLPGMPPCHFGDVAIYYPNLSEHGDGAIYVTWSTEPPELPADHPDKHRQHGVDLAIWEPVKLSEYYAVLEAIQERPEAEERAS